MLYFWLGHLTLFLSKFSNQQVDINSAWSDPISAYSAVFNAFFKFSVIAIKSIRFCIRPVFRGVIRYIYFIMAILIIIKRCPPFSKISSFDVKILPQLMLRLGVLSFFMARKTVCPGRDIPISFRFVSFTSFLRFGFGNFVLNG